ncbi:hypothetical protein BDV12DRAFT_61290 [Aspergillus spectabilis]
MSFPKPHIKLDSFFHETSLSPPPSTSSPWPTTIYFITGNPGLISYYHTFLSLLGAKLSTTSGSDPIHIVGHSLAGFELDSAKDGTRSGKEEYYYDVEEQIRSVQGKLEAHMRSLRDSTATATGGSLDAQETENQKEKPRVILIGHSVGSYIAMEILRRHREGQVQAQAHASGQGLSTDTDFDITGSILLFPTVMDIAKSLSGRKLTFLLSLIPNLALVISLLARVLTTLLPNSILRAIIGLVMNSPPAEALNATFAFLKSKRGVRQALYMATDEMRTITTDKWSDDVWGVSSSNPISSELETELDTKSQVLPPAQLYFYFGRNDHWVAERTREEIVAARGISNLGQGQGNENGSEKGMGPRMVVCEESVPHAFCLRHNEVMAGKVVGMIGEILK